MRVLLILPDTKGSLDVYKPSSISKILRFFYPGVDAGSRVLLPPLGLLTIAACTPEHIDIEIIDEKVNGRVNLSNDADLIGISIFAHTARRGYEIADQFRKKGHKVVLGGFHASFMIKEALEHADAVVVGEAEPVWGQMLEDAHAGRLKRIYNGNSLLALKHTPFPRFDEIDMKRYMLKHVIQATRGCPFDCDFCSVAAFFGGTFRVKPVEQVLHELGPLNEGEWICFVDDNIVGSPRYAADLFKALIPLKIRWIAQSSITIADDKELLKLAAESGCACLLIGIETVEPANVAYMGGKIKLDRLEEQLGRVHEAGIGINGTFILGLDGDTLETFEKTASFCINNYIELPSFMVFNPIPGTPMFNQMRQDGRLRVDGYREYEALLFRRKIFYTLRGISETDFYEGFDRMCRMTYSYTNILRRNMKYRTSFKEFLYGNFVWRQCDLQLGRRSLAKHEPLEI
jgi:radical SAM superfamily enzyme YgiQ (UPF0313 family)